MEKEFTMKNNCHIVVTKHKGVVLELNDTKGVLMGEGKYAVYCGDKKFPFKTIKEFTNAVNGVSDYDDSVPVYVAFIENDKWGHAPLKEFKDFILKNKAIEEKVGTTAYLFGIH